MFTLYLLMIFMTIFLSSLILMVGMFLSLKSYIDLEKLSPFECGFLSYEESRSPFSLQFFLVSLIFLVFDIELILLFPYISSSINSISFMVFMGFFLFLVILSWGLFYEWSNTKLEWKI